MRKIIYMDNLAPHIEGLAIVLTGLMEAVQEKLVIVLTIQMVVAQEELEIRLITQMVLHPDRLGALCITQMAVQLEELEIALMGLMEPIVVKLVIQPIVIKPRKYRGRAIARPLSKWLGEYSWGWYVL